MKDMKALNVFAMLFAAACLLVLPGCRNPLEPRDMPANEPETAGTGTLSLTINRQGAERTIRPEISLGDFVEFHLEFLAMCDSGNNDFGVTWTRDYIADGPGTVELNAGTWDLHVTAYIANGEGELLEAARGDLEGIEVVPGDTIDGNLTLFPIAAGRGTFAWDIGFPTSVASAEMEVIRINGDGDTQPKTFNFIGGDTLDDNPGGIELYAGRYRMFFTMYNDRKERAELRAILHIYQNMTSTFDETFTYGHFPVSLLNLILDAWNAASSSWEFAARGISAAHFSLLGIEGIDDDNFAAIVGWFNDLSTAATVPNDLPGLKTLVDAALIGVASTDDDFLDAANYLHRAYAEDAIAGLIENGTDITLDWTDGNAVTVRIGEPVVYEVNIVFSGAILPELTGTVSIIGTAQVGQTLTADTSALGGTGTITFQWLRGATVIGTNSGTYIVQTADLGHAITVTVTRSGNAGSVASDPTAPVNQREDFTISFADFLEVATDIIGPTLRIIGNPEETSRNITVINPAQYDDDSIRWLFDGTRITGDVISGTHGETLTLDSRIHNNRIGTHFVTVVVSKDGVSYSRRIAFMVVP